MSKYGLEKTQDKVEFSAYSDDYKNSMIFGHTIDGNYYCKSRFDGTWDTVNLATKNDIPARYGNTGIVIPAGKSCKISAAMDAVFTALVCVQGKSGNGSGTFIISGYGLDGGTSRYRVQDLNTSAALSRITCVVGDGTFFTVNNGTGVSVYLVIEEFFNQGEITCSII